MSDKKTTKDSKEPELTMEDRLKGVLYQFVTLYDRWREDRQIAAKRDAEIAELAEAFTRQVNELEAVGVKMRHDMRDTIEKVLIIGAKESVKTIKEGTAGAVDATVKRLEDAVGDTRKALTETQEVLVENRGFKMSLMWVVVIGIGALVGMGVAKFVMPSPVLPLTSQQIYELRIGRVLALAKPKMNKEELNRIRHLADQAVKAKNANTAGQADTNYSED